MFNELNHHFYIIEGDIEANDAELRSYLVEKEKIELSSNPDLYVGDYSSLSIDDSRALKDFFSTKTFGEGKRIAIIKTSTITREAQNALLKLTEEPAEKSHIFFLIPHIGLLIHTLRSRGQRISTTKESSSVEGKSFVRKEIPERLSFVQKIVTKKDRAAAVVLVESLIAWGRVEASPEILKEIYIVRSYIEDTSSSIKLLLEHLSLILPVSK